MCQEKWFKRRNKTTVTANDMNRCTENLKTSTYNIKINKLALQRLLDILPMYRNQCTYIRKKKIGI
jgi:hypothetical protein